MVDVALSCSRAWLFQLYRIFFYLRFSFWWFYFKACSSRIIYGLGLIHFQLPRLTSQVSSFLHIALLIVVSSLNFLIRSMFRYSSSFLCFFTFFIYFSSPVLIYDISSRFCYFITLLFARNILQKHDSSLGISSRHFRVVGGLTSGSWARRRFMIRSQIYSQRGFAPPISPLASRTRF